MHADGGRSIFAELTRDPGDILILAGDITTARYPDAVRDMFAYLAPKYRNILYVLGNHEFYRSTPQDTLIRMRRAADAFINVRVCNNETVQIGSQRFVCGTGWFPPPSRASLHAKVYMNDFYQIRSFEPWVYRQYELMRALLTQCLCKDDIVVTHHLPSTASISAQYAQSPLNAFFMADFEDLIKERHPRYWIHGHTHIACRYQIHGTEVVCNPLGYPNEFGSTRKFDPSLKIAI